MGRYVYVIGRTDNESQDSGPILILINTVISFNLKPREMFS